MKKIVLFLSLLVSVSSYAQTLYADDNGVKVFYEIERTDQFTTCQSGKNYSEEKINIWKITLGIENGHTSSIVPRGVGVANIIVNPIPLRPYSSDYCNYRHVENFDSDAGYIDQSLFIWPIRNYAVKEIKSGEILTNITYLYLYESQKPRLTDSEFLGYRLKEDFKSNDVLLASVDNNTKIDHNDYKERTESPNSANITFDTRRAKSRLTPQITLAKARKSDVLEKVTIEDIYNANSKKTPLIETKNSNSTLKEKRSINYSPVKETKVAIKNTSNSTATKCPGAKALEYKNKSSSDPSEQRAYSWLAIYYTYKCECEMGSSRSDQLPIIINNIVDSYTTNTNDSYGKISKVSKCKSN